MLQEAVDALFDNGVAARFCAARTIVPLKSLVGNAQRKSRDVFVKICLGKRVDYSGRSVIVVGPELKITSVRFAEENGSGTFQAVYL
jgi:DNA-directed RNA polymerase subunit beta'